MTPDRVWSGDFVARELDVDLSTDAGIVPVEALVGLALRHNPRRAHLLVSTVLAKHVPTDPGLALAAAALLGALVEPCLDGSAADDDRMRTLGTRLAALLQAPVAERVATTALREVIAERRTAHPEVVTLGFAETATGLGRVVADQLGTYYVHSTRRESPEVVAFAGFEEEHSHATSHRLYPSDHSWLKPGGTVVLVDDELSTGATIVNTIRALQVVVPQSLWCVASLVDLRSSTDRARFRALEVELGVKIAEVALGSGRIALPADALSRADRILDSLPHASHPSHETALADVVVHDLTRVAPSIAEDRFGSPASERDDLAAAVSGASAGGAPAAIARALDGALVEALAADDEQIVVLGTEEFIALPLAVADRLAASRPPGRVLFSTTTRSPIRAVDRPDYAIASVLPFSSHDVGGDEVVERFAYNLTPGGRRPDRVVVFPEPGAMLSALLAPGRLVETLRAVTDHVDVVVLAPRPPRPTGVTAGA